MGLVPSSWDKTFFTLSLYDEGMTYWTSHHESVVISYGTGAGEEEGGVMKRGLEEGFNLMQHYRG